METKVISETLVFSSALTQLITQDFSLMTGFVISSVELLDCYGNVSYNALLQFSSLVIL
jgi:hypothetical protein